jgi:hypothetical protein
MRRVLLALVVLASGCLPLPSSRHRGTTEATYLVIGGALLVGAVVGIVLDLQPEVEIPPRPIRPTPNP